ncbi:5768_t:CDS:1, partial [Entrophospora sp. SA101]
TSILENDLNEDDLNVEVSENEVDNVSFSDFGNDLTIDRSLDQKLKYGNIQFSSFLVNKKLYLFDLANQK